MTTNRENWIPPMEPGDEPLDPDILLITNWLGDELSPEQVAEVEERLVNDEAFHAKAAPYVEMWAERGEYPLELVVTLPRRVLRWQAMGTRARAASLLAAALLLMVGPGFVAYRMGFDEGERGAWSLVPSGGGAAAAGEDRIERIGHGTVVHLRGSARCKCEPTWFNRTPSIGLRGEVFIEVGWLDSEIQVITPAGRVWLRPGTYALRVRDGADDGETLVTVGRGVATIRGQGEATVLAIGPGEYGRLWGKVAPQRGVGGEGYPALGAK